MRKGIIIIIVLLARNTAFGQTKFAIKSGINIATIKDINSDPKNRLGWYGGGALNIKLKKDLFLQTELLYSSIGYRYIGDLNSNSKTTTRLNYLNIPALLNYNIDKRTSIFIGPQIGYLLSAYTFLPNKEKFNIYHNFPVKIDYGIDVGANYRICNKVGLELRYIYEVKNIYRTDASGTRIDDKLAGNRVFQIGASYFLN